MGGNSGTIFLRYKRKGILYYSYVKSTGSDYLVGFLAHWSIVTDGFGEKELANHSAIPSPVVIRATQDLVTFLRGVSLTPELCPQ